jgi:hypothetical protein
MQLMPHARGSRFPLPKRSVRTGAHAYGSVLRQPASASARGGAGGRTVRLGGILLSAWMPIVLVGLSACDTPSPKLESAETPIESVARLEKSGTLTEEDGVPFFSDPSFGVITDGGEVAFIDQANQQLAVFDSSGTRRISMGRRGQGPGEFLSPQAVYSLHKDTLAVFDRQKLLVTLFTHGQTESSSIRFDRWPFNADDQLQLVGRFASGEWVALRRAPRQWRRPIVKSAVDTPALLVGGPDEPPRELLLLTPRRFVDFVSKGLVARIALDEIAPSIGAICDSGVVVVDTLGIRTFGSDGRMRSNSRLPFKRVSVDRLGQGLVGVVDRATYTIKAIGGHGDVERALFAISEGADSVLQRPNIDALGLIWFPRATESGGAWVRVNQHGRILGAFKSEQSPALIGKRFAVTLGFDSTSASGALGVVRVPMVDVQNTGLGRCSTPFSY